MRIFDRFLSNKQSVLIAVLSVLLAVCHTFQFIVDGDKDLLIKIIFLDGLSLSVIIFGIKSVPFVLLPFGLTLATYMTCEDFTPFILVISAVLIRHKRNFSIVSFILYLSAVFFVCTVHKKTGVHIAVHLIGCMFLSVVGWIISLSGALYYFNQYKGGIIESHKTQIQSVVLDLTDEEYFLLHAICIDKQLLKNLGKPNTISHKLQKCYQKNNLSSTNELYAKFLQSEANLYGNHKEPRKE